MNERKNRQIHMVQETQSGSQDRQTDGRRKGGDSDKNARKGTRTTSQGKRARKTERQRTLEINKQNQRTYKTAILGLDLDTKI